ncbi:coiled-coil domain-containing protein 15 isoform X2 [Sceloporus undulatus]|uniref:coiled-coil domain-containing protein 15 isoform X2 n=1 Tax=Sceloporus undulatus TaxID=8520 RepID=UPI001C4DC4E5|nr:coiled-coil domain-containing protein 15 isoform X2 [Sceloporus undulatus]
MLPPKKELQPQCLQRTAKSTAARIEKEYKEQLKEKERSLKRFQEEVKHRVNQRVKLRRKQQLQKSYEAALKESSVAIGFSDSALQLTPKKSTCLYRCSTDSSICKSGSKLISGEEPTFMIEWGEKAQAKTVKKTVQQAVRHRLASRKSASGDAPPELPGGAWKSCTDKKMPGSCNTTSVNAEKGVDEDFPLVGCHDLPTELQNQEHQGKDLNYIIEFKKVNSEILKGTFSASGTENWAPQILWPGREIEESKKERQSQYLRYRRLFMDIEREQVKEQQRQKECQRKMDKIKREKEQQRHIEEQRIMEKYHAKEQGIQERLSQEDANSKGKACEKLEHLKLEDSKDREKVVEKHQRNKEYARYAEALRAQMREKIKMYNINLPPLCFCGSDFWDSHPDSCANNCVFYKNHKAYAQALQSVISSCNVLDGGSNTRLAVHTFATVHAHSKNS